MNTRIREIRGCGCRASGRTVSGHAMFRYPLQGAFLPSCSWLVASRCPEPTLPLGFPGFSLYLAQSCACSLTSPGPPFSLWSPDWAPGFP